MKKNKKMAARYDLNNVQIAEPIPLSTTENLHRIRDQFLDANKTMVSGRAMPNDMAQKSKESSFGNNTIYSGGERTVRSQLS